MHRRLLESPCDNLKQVKCNKREGCQWDPNDKSCHPETEFPTAEPTLHPTDNPTLQPTAHPTTNPTLQPIQHHRYNGITTILIDSRVSTSEPYNIMYR